MRLDELNILISCEASQTICKAFRQLNFNAFSNDIVKCYGGYPEWHLQMDAFEALKIKEWHLLIAHPPCQYLSYVGNKWLKDEYNLQYDLFDGLVTRKDKRINAFKFFMKFVNANVQHICIENPVGIVGKWYRKQDQIIHPYYFGDDYKKRTCLWLKNLPLLEKTNLLPEPKPYYYTSTKKKPIQWVESVGRNKNSRQIRSKTFPGIAEAMAKQWGDYLKKYYNVSSSQ